MILSNILSNFLLLQNKLAMMHHSAPIAKMSDIIPAPKLSSLYALEPRAMDRTNSNRPITRMTKRLPPLDFFPKRRFPRRYTRYPIKKIVIHRAALKSSVTIPS